VSQYFDAFPGHAAMLNKPLSPDLAQHWRRLSQELKFPAGSLPASDGNVTRGGWIRARRIQRQIEIGSTV